MKGLDNCVIGSSFQRSQEDKNKKIFSFFQNIEGFTSIVPLCSIGGIDGFCMSRKSPDLESIHEIGNVKTLERSHLSALHSVSFSKESFAQKSHKSLDIKKCESDDTVRTTNCSLYTIQTNDSQGGNILGPARGRMNIKQSDHEGERVDFQCQEMKTSNHSSSEAAYNIESINKSHLVGTNDENDNERQLNDNTLQYAHAKKSGNLNMTKNSIEENSAGHSIESSTTVLDTKLVPKVSHAVLRRSGSSSSLLKGFKTYAKKHNLNEVDDRLCTNANYDGTPGGQTENKRGSERSDTVSRSQSINSTNIDSNDNRSKSTVMVETIEDADESCKARCKTTETCTKEDMIVNNENISPAIPGHNISIEASNNVPCQRLKIVNSSAPTDLKEERKEKNLKRTSNNEFNAEDGILKSRHQIISSDMRCNISITPMLPAKSAALKLRERGSTTNLSRKLNSYTLKI